MAAAHWWSANLRLRTAGLLDGRPWTWLNLAKPLFRFMTRLLWGFSRPLSIIVRQRCELQGRPFPSEAMMHFPLVSDFPDKFLGLCRKFSRFYLFRENISIFIRQNNFWWPFLVIDHKFEIFPSLFSFFPSNSPLFRPNLSFPPTLPNFPPWFRKISVFCTCFLWFLFSSYFYHDAFMHHKMHVLDARGGQSPYLFNLILEAMPSQHWNFAPFIARMGV